MRVFIIGITGGVGSRLARLLSQQGNEVSGFYRNPNQITSIYSLGANGILGDIATISDHDLATAMTGADAVVFAAGAGDQDNDSMIDMIDEGGVRKSISALRLSCIARFILVSVFPEAWRERHLGKSFEHYMRAKKKADVELVRSGLDWIILRPSALQDAPGTGTISLGLAEIHDEITRDDVAATIVGLLQTPTVQRRILEVTAGKQPIAQAISALAS